MTVAPAFVVVLYLLPPDGSMVPAFKFTAWEHCEVFTDNTITDSMCKRVDIPSELAPRDSLRPAPRPTENTQ